MQSLSIPQERAGAGARGRAPSPTLQRALGALVLAGVVVAAGGIGTLAGVAIPESAPVPAPASATDSAWLGQSALPKRVPLDPAPALEAELTAPAAEAGGADPAVAPAGPAAAAEVSVEPAEAP